jgi:hypothetical protein
MKKPACISGLALIICVLAAPAPVFSTTVNTLHFDETNAPADGLTEQGVLFNFSFGNSPSQDAVYGQAYPFSDQLLQDFVLGGPAQGVADPSQSGALTFTFFQATHVLNFAVALSTGADDRVGLQLYDALGSALIPVSIATTYDHVNCDPGTEICPSEAEFTYAGDAAIGRATLTFDGTNADSFAVDNLQYELPEPSTVSMLLPGSAALLLVWRRRKRREAVLDSNLP